MKISKKKKGKRLKQKGGEKLSQKKGDKGFSFLLFVLSHPPLSAYFPALCPQTLLGDTMTVTFLMESEIFWASKAPYTCHSERYLLLKLLL